MLMTSVLELPGGRGVEPPTSESDPPTSPCKTVQGGRLQPPTSSKLPYITNKWSVKTAHVNKDDIDSGMTPRRLHAVCRRWALGSTSSQ
jgi:hypothetical protein